MDDLQQVAYEAKIKALESELSRLQTAYGEECAVVDRVWHALEIESYPQAHGKPIHTLVAELKAEVAYWETRSWRRGQWLIRYVSGENFDVPTIGRIIAEVQGLVDGEFVKVDPEGR